MALIWVALVGLILILFVAIAGDTAYVYLTGHQLQNAADSAALAGVWEVRDDPTNGGNRHPADDKAQLVAGQNFAGHNGGNSGAVAVQLALNYPANAASGDIVIGVYDSGTQTFTPTLTSPNAVKVVARRTNGSLAGPLPLIFGPMAGVNNSNVSRTAIAVVGGPGLGAGLIVLNRHASPAVQMTGTGSTGNKITVIGGAVQVNSDSDNAVNWSGDPPPQIVASNLYVGGNEPSASAVITNGTLTTDAPPVDDPLAGLPIPPQGPAQNGNGTTLNPGYYNNNFPTNKSVTLNPGVYFIDGGIRMTGNRVITATSGVMIFLNSGGINLGGTSELHINPPTTGPYAGISIYQRRGNTSDSSLQGTPTTNNSGVFYFPSANLSVAGNPIAYATQIIADTIKVQGNSQININYNNGGGFPIQGHKVWLAQ